jgi:TrmH family RNA methyltransferase
MLVLDAFASGALVTEVYVDAAALDRAAAGDAARPTARDTRSAEPDAELRRLVSTTRAAGIEVRLLGPGALAQAASTTTPQPALAVVQWRPMPLDTLDWSRVDPVLVLDGLTDPGNVGTLLRVAEAAGFGAVLTTPGTVDVTNPKVVRSASGALLRMTVADQADPSVLAERAHDAGVTLVGTVARGGVDHDSFGWTAPVGLVLGSEAHGIGPELDALLDARVTIPMAGNVESLNAAIAGAVVAFELARARRRAS